MNQITPNADILLAAALEAMKHAYVPYSRFHVGAAILDSEGRTHTGCNVENASYGATICAERTAAVKAVSAGARKFVAIAIVSDSDKDTTPCGICRQFLAEFSSADMPVWCGNSVGAAHQYRMEDLLPNAFGAADMPGEPSEAVQQGLTAGAQSAGKE